MDISWMNSITNLTAQQLRRAADLQEQIQSLREELAEILSSPIAPPSRATAAKAPKRQISAAGKARIAAAARARWARYRAAKPKSARPASNPKRTISAAGRARIAAVARARWARAKASGRNRL